MNTKGRIYPLPSSPKPAWIFIRTSKKDCISPKIIQRKKCLLLSHEVSLSVRKNKKKVCETCQPSIPTSELGQIFSKTGSLRRRLAISSSNGDTNDGSEQTAISPTLISSTSFICASLDVGLSPDIPCAGAPPEFTFANGDRGGVRNATHDPAIVALPTCSSIHSLIVPNMINHNTTLSTCSAYIYMYN